jgi:hypothetical protein
MVDSAPGVVCNHEHIPPPNCHSAGGVRDQKQPGRDDDGPSDARDALTGRRETFNGDGRPHDSHRSAIDVELRMSAQRHADQVERTAL